jgi:hypothetical protein
MVQVYTTTPVLLPFADRTNRSGVCPDGDPFAATFTLQDPEAKGDL